MIHSFIVDLYCPEARLVVEDDGGIYEYQRDYDRERTAILQALGYQLLCIENETIENTLEMALAEIRTRSVQIAIEAEKEN